MGLLDGKVAIVTGGGRGLGRAHCLALAEAGATVVVNDLGAGLHGEEAAESPADEVVAEITKLGGRAAANGGSVADWQATEALVADTVAEFGRLDIVVNNAGILRDRMIFSMTEAEFDAVIAVHLKGTFGLTRHACAYWREAFKRGEPIAGRVINTTSGTGLFGQAGQSNYGAAKAGIANLTTIAAMEMRRYGVTVNAISPIAATRMTAGMLKGGTPGENGFDPLDPANASGVVVYLASDAAGWLTGQVLRVDGDKLNRMQSWTIASTHHARTGEAVTADELVEALPQLYGTAPAGRPVGLLPGKP
ncbi:SDR family NAD(P)-dependent oxidoreductase [Spirillospora sp. CA-142024]|uniref:SDR family NAD(P)-dependent oxidoreductase n=1 Tax=Spirillospora sp. CA-142024 TaxID=3240036 RepID=UPI003D8ED44E